MGAQYGLDILWSVLICLPLMIAIQSICARIACVTGKGLAGNIKAVFPRWLLTLLVVLLRVANVINIAADVAALGEAAALVLPGIDDHVYVVAFALVSLLLQVFVPYNRYVGVLKGLTLALLAYVAVIFTVKITWGPGSVADHRSAAQDRQGQPDPPGGHLGTTISPYLFFWQSSEAVEELEKSRMIRR